MSSYLHNGISYTGKMASVYWIGARVSRYRYQFHDEQETLKRNIQSWQSIPFDFSLQIINLQANLYPEHKKVC